MFNPQKIIQGFRGIISGDIYFSGVVKLEACSFKGGSRNSATSKIDLIATIVCNFQPIWFDLFSFPSLVATFALSEIPHRKSR